MILFINGLVSLLAIGYIVILLRNVLKNKISKIGKLYFVLLCIIHLVTSYMFFHLIDQEDMSIDALRFYKYAAEAKKWSSLFGLGSSFMSFLIYPFVKLGVRIEVLFLLFSTISFKGFLLYFEMLNIKEVAKRNWFVLVLFLMPSLHFWTGILGKEALLFFLMGYILKKMKDKSFNSSVILAFSVMFFIRPHAFFVIAFGFLIVLLFEKDISKKTKCYLVIIPSIITIALAPIFLKYFLKIDNINIVGIKDYLSAFLNYTVSNTGNSPISIIDSNLFTRILMLLFMPLPYVYDIKNSFQWAVAIENIYFLFIFIYFLYYFSVNGIKMNIAKIDIKFAFITSILLIVLFGSYIYNLGLASRMRVMFFPYLFYVLIIAFNSVKNNLHIE